jgi:hypothetical protein
MKKGFTGILSVSLSVLFLFNHVKGYAQQWTAAFPFGTNTAFVDAATAIATDAGGNVYITGKFGVSINFGAFTLTATPGGTQTEGFVAGFNSAGICQWAVRFGGPGTDLGGMGIATDGTNVYVTGGSAFPCTVGAAPIVAAGASSDGVVFALNAGTGAFVWGKGLAVRQPVTADSRLQKMDWATYIFQVFSSHAVPIPLPLHHSAHRVHFPGRCREIWRSPHQIFS